MTQGEWAMRKDFLKNMAKGSLMFHLLFILFSFFEIFKYEFIWAKTEDIAGE